MTSSLGSRSDWWARILSIAALVGLWAALSGLATDRTLPSPQAVLGFALQDSLHGDLVFNLGMTLWRVTASYVIAMAAGTVLGVLLGLNRRADTLLDTWLLILLNLPALVLAILCYVWLGLTETAAITAVALNKVPSVVVILREGTRSLDRDLEEMARAYRMPTGTWLRHVVAPQLAPYAAAASRTGLALVWKIVLVVELLGRSNGVGYAISTAFQLFDVRAILAYALVFTSVMLGIEFLVLQPVERHVRRWRSPAH